MKWHHDDVAYIRVRVEREMAPDDFDAWMVQMTSGTSSVYLGALTEDLLSPEEVAQELGLK